MQHANASTITSRTAAEGARMLAALRTPRPVPATSTNPATPFDVALACSRAGRKDLAPELIAEGATLQRVRARLAEADTAGTVLQDGWESPLLRLARQDAAAAARAEGAERAAPALDVRAIHARANARRADRGPAASAGPQDAARSSGRTVAVPATAPAAALDGRAIFDRFNARRAPAAGTASAAPAASAGGLDPAAIYARMNARRA